MHYNKLRKQIAVNTVVGGFNLEIHVTNVTFICVLTVRQLFLSCRHVNGINFAITAVIKSFMYLSLESLAALSRSVLAFPECFRVEVISVAITRILDTLPTLCTKS